MKILSFKPGHDGSIVGVDANQQNLLFSYEAEKGGFPSNSAITPDTFIQAGNWFNDLPDVIALSGWSTLVSGREHSSGAGYLGVGKGSENFAKTTFFGKTLDYYSSTHERSHIWAAYAMSPYPQGEPCYVLVWEGIVGGFYEIDRNLQLHHIGQVMSHPGRRFSFFHALADPKHPDNMNGFGKKNAGGMMTANARGDEAKADQEALKLINSVLAKEDPEALLKSDYDGSNYYNIGTDTARFENLAAAASDKIFSSFYDFAKANLRKGYPLLVSGGCGLNCDWNSRWTESDLFDHVFVPPCTSDSGSAIGTAVDAMRHYTGNAKLDWSVYAGPPFKDEPIDSDDVSVKDLNLREIAQALNEGMVIGWATGNCEIGPRALGNRSILAAPFSEDIRTRLNRAKGRDDNAPISPVCLEEDVSEHFEWSGQSPHMMHFMDVKDPRLKAVRYADGSARVQTVSGAQNPKLYDLLKAFKDVSGVGVLCNTSLNFQGAGFINGTIDLYHYASRAELDGFVAGISFYRFS